MKQAEALRVEQVRYLTVTVEVEIPDSADDSAVIAERSLYGHSDVTAFFKVKFRLLPCGGKTSSYEYYPEHESEPEVELESATTFWQDQDGGEYERDYYLTYDQYQAALAEALKYAKKAVRGLHFEELKYER